MSLITKTGQAAKESAEQKGIDFDKVYMRLKDGDSVRVRLLGIADNTVGEYHAHGDFKKGLYTTPCIEPTGEECPYCVAANSGVEGYEKFYARKRYLILFADIDSNTVRAWDASKQQGEAMLKLLTTYAGAKDTMSFNFTRTGSGASDTNYNLIPDLAADDATKAKFEKSKELAVPENFFDSILIPKTPEQMIENLKKAGFPVDDFFTEVDASESDIDTGTEDGQTIDIKDDDLPF